MAKVLNIGKVIILFKKNLMQTEAQINNVINSIKLQHNNNNNYDLK